MMAQVICVWAAASRIHVLSYRVTEQSTQTVAEVAPPDTWGADGYIV